MRSEAINNSPNAEKSGVSASALIDGRSEAAYSCKTSQHDLLTSHVNIGQFEQDLPLALVLGDATITRFSMAKQIFHNVKRMLHARSDTGIDLLNVLREGFFSPSGSFMM